VLSRFSSFLLRIAAFPSSSVTNSYANVCNGCAKQALPPPFVVAGATRCERACTA
jgi:hypothetical protein